MRKRFFLFVAVVAAFVMAAAAPKAKYVFFFIGDGMGVNQVNGTETYLGALKGRIGIEPLCFPSFPNSAFVNTQSATNGVTDSAAGGTALATGNKTKNGALGVLKDLTTRVKSIAEEARDEGYAVGISTTVSVDHATPGAFYAHVKNRNMYHEIGLQLIDSKFDFFAGSEFLQPNKNGEDLYELCRKGGYTIARGLKDFEAKKTGADRIILFQTPEAARINTSCLPYKLDRKADDLTLRQIAESGIDYLMNRHKKGFFFMLEGGKIDWGCHSNDAAAAFNEIIDMDAAVKVAYEFYKKHPKETLIVISADHETGGLALGRGPYELHLDRLQYQRNTAAKFSARADSLFKSKGADNVTWDDMKALLTDGFGFWSHVNISADQENRLKASFEATKAGAARQKNEYDSTNGISTTAKKVLDECALVGWQSGGHSNGYVPVFAIGAGAEQYHGRIDNTLIPKYMAKAMGINFK
jgi:alkaline phosphatase